MPSILTLVTIPPPANIAQYAEQLAQLETPVGVFEAFVHHERHQVIICTPTNEWWVQSDADPIMRTMQQLCPALGANPCVQNLAVVAPHGPFNVDDEISMSLQSCAWNDYTCDRLVFTVDIVPSAVPSTFHSTVPNTFPSTFLSTFHSTITSTAEIVNNVLVNIHDDRCDCNACHHRLYIS